MGGMVDGGFGRSPLQGGLPPPGMVTGAVVEIACDESGFSGTNLIRSTEPVITHAGTDLRPDEAATLITAMRSEFRLSPHELKSGHFLRRPGADQAATWFLNAVRGRAGVHLVDKEFFLVTRVIDLFLAEPTYAAGTHLTPATRAQARILHRAGHPLGESWRSFLAAFEDMVRTKRRRPPALFFQHRDHLLSAGLPAEAATILNRLNPPTVHRILTRLDADDRTIPPPLEPMLPALAETILRWSAAPSGRPLPAPPHQAFPPSDVSSSGRPHPASPHQTFPPPDVSSSGHPHPAPHHQAFPPSDVSPSGRPHPPPQHQTSPPSEVSPSGRPHPPPHHQTSPPSDVSSSGFPQRSGSRSADQPSRHRVLVIHDEQSALTADRLTRLGRALADPTTGVSPLAGLVMADSRDDPRIQVADLLAGIARRRTDLLPTELRSPTSLLPTGSAPE